MLDNTDINSVAGVSILDKIISEQQATHIKQFKPEEAVNKLLSNLSERERQVLWRRFALGGGKAETLENIGQFFRVTRERIRQIERLATQKLRELARTLDLMHPLRQVVVEVLESEGGVMAAARLQKKLSDMAEGVKIEIINFVLDELLNEVVERVGGEGTEFKSGWRLRTASIDSLRQLINRAQDIISLQGSVMSSQDLAKAIASAGLAAPLGGNLQEQNQILNLLDIGEKVRSNPFDEWGFAHWETISPRRMNDKVYLVLKKAGKPLHFREIVRLINEQHFDKKVAYPPTIHNELILDKKYVLVGRGIYALREWGYKPVVVADVLAAILTDSGRPLTMDELVQKVMAQRVVKRGTIQLALTNRQRFQKTADGRYTLAGKIDTANNQTAQNQ
ncbi:MAG: hypothetical protein HY973_04250 [Candidatus Kerfeldbacteria bacterium]|nr:hypothetical protein [Candidatus Kerfeldbacteria bacterium]